MTAGSRYRVAFFLAAEGDLERLAALDPDRDTAELQRGERIWILQTFLRLHRAGFDCELVDRVPADGLVVFHAKQERDLRRRMPPGGAPVLVGVRADNRQPLAAEFEIVQNGRFADGRVRHLVPHWPQPGLVPRAADCATRVERVAYKGFAENLDPGFRSESWRRALAERGVEWELDERGFAGAAHDGTPLGWGDYSRIDVLLAVRPGARKTGFSKPASKLVNAWLAGTPAILGPEYAYRELRRSELDYFEAANPEQALAAIDRLRASPELYRAMVENGRARARDYDARAVAARWIELLGDRLPRLAEDPGRTRRRRLPLTLRRAARIVARWASLRPPR